MNKVSFSICFLLILLFGCTPKNIAPNDNTSAQGEGVIDVNVLTFKDLGEVENLRFIRNSSILFTDGELVHLIDLNKLKAVIFPQKNETSAVHIKSQKLALGLSDGRILLLDTVTTKLIDAYQNRMVPQSLVFSPDGTVLAIDTGATLHILNLIEGKSVHKFYQSGSGPYQFSPDGKYLAFRTVINGDMKNSTVNQYDLSTNEMYSEFKIEGTIRDLKYSPDGKLLAINVSDRGGLIKPYETRLHLFDAKTGKELFKLEYDEYIIDMIFTPDGEKLAIGTAKGSLAQNGIIRIIQISDGDVLAKFEDDDKILDLDFTSKKGFLAAVSGTNTIYGRHSKLMIFDLKTSERVYTLKSDVFANSCSFSEDGRFLVFGGRSSPVRILDFAPHKPTPPSGNYLEMVQNDRF